MKKLIITLALMVAVASANAATASLVQCTSGRSVTGQFIYIGVYQYNGQRFERYFQSYCPYSVDVY